MALLDQWGRPLAIGRRPPRDADRVIARVLDRSYTRFLNIGGGLTPYEIGRILEEAESGFSIRQALLAKEMERRDVELGATLQTRRLAVLALPWEIQPFSDSDEDKEISDFVQANLDELNWDQYLTHLLDNVMVGYALMWIHWDLMPGTQQAHISRFEEVPVSRVTHLPLDHSPEAPMPRYPKLLSLAHPTYGEEIPAWNAVYHEQIARSGFAHEIGLVRGIAWLYLIKNYVLKDWAVYSEKFATPMRIGKYPAGSLDEDVQKLKDALRDLTGDSAAVIPDSMIIELLEVERTSGNAQGVQERLVSFINRQYQHGILGQEASTGGTPGRLGNDKAQIDVRGDLLAADARALTATTKNQVIRPLVGFNFGFEKPLPSFRLMYRKPEDMKSLAETYKLVAEIAPIPKKHFYERMNIPMPQEDEETIGGTAMMQPPPPQPMNEDAV